MKTLVTRILLLASLILTVGATPALAISEGGACSSSKYGNSLVMSNGKIHGGSLGSNKNYVGPLYLCDGGSWVWWETAQPQPKQTKQTTVNATPGTACSSIGKIVTSTYYGQLQCRYVRSGRLQLLMWFRM
jgi:hypothetical protein